MSQVNKKQSDIMIGYLQLAIRAIKDNQNLGVADTYVRLYLSMAHDNRITDLLDNQVTELEATLMERLCVVND